VTAYRFCRTDDIALLVDALNRCWGPSFPDEPAVSPAAFKRSIRDLQVWCSSCMVAFAGPDPIAVLIGAKRPSGTLIHRIAVHPDHQRQGHGRHLLESLGSKLAILGPPRIVAEVPERFEAAGALFSACGFAEEALLTDYVLENDLATVGAAPRAARFGHVGDVPLPEPCDLADSAARRTSPPPTCGGAVASAGRFVIPVTVDDLAANGLLDDADPHVCWSRSIETLTATKDEIAGVAVASDERIEAYLLYLERPGEGTKIVALRSFVEDGGTRLALLLSRLRGRGVNALQFPKVSPSEISNGCLETLGFTPAARYLRYAAAARSQ
jgi:ribosomal protein S18 acetylase RimI-like enzyme